MKGTKLICAALSGMLLAALAVPCSADEDHTAETYEGEGFTLSYLLEDAGASVVGCSGDAVNVTVPDTLGGKPVTAVEEGAFNNCGSIESVTMPDTVTLIGDGAFFGCTTLKSITMPESLTKIGYQAFYYCTDLESVTLPDKLQTIGNQAFLACLKLTSVSLPASLTTLGEYAFEGCTELTEIKVDPENTVYCDLEGVLFNAGKTELIKYPDHRAGDSYTLPDGTTAIADWGFTGAKDLVSLDLNQVTDIGKDAFYTCTALEQITIPEGVTALPGSAFGGCTALKQVQLPDSLTELGSYCFVNCPALTDMTVPGSVATIGDYALGFTIDTDTKETAKVDGFTLHVQVGTAAASYARSNDISYEKQNAAAGLALVIAGGVLLLAGTVFLVLILRDRKQAPLPEADAAGEQETPDAPEKE